MKIIRTMVLRYMKQNKKRTIAAIVGITFSVMMLTVITIFTFTMIHSLIGQEVRENGSWHVRFHNLSQEQFEELKGSEKIKECSVSQTCLSHDYSRDAKLCADVEMKHVSYMMFGTTQKMAAELGMEKLPYGTGELLPNRKISEYDVSYHMNLLEYYGTSTADGMGNGIMMFGMLGLFIILAAVFVYNFYAASMHERIRYIGMLGSAGAVKNQRAAVMLYEGLVEGVVAFPIGLLLGMTISRAGVWIFNASGAAGERMTLICDVKCILVILLSTVMMLLLAITGPVRQAAEITLAQQLTASSPKGLDGQSFTSLRKRHRILGTEGAIGIKNVFRNEPRYVVTCVLILISICLLLDGYTYFDENDYVADRRKRPELGTWVEVQDKDPNVLSELFEQISGIEGVTSVTSEMSIDHEISLAGERIRIQLTGLDDRTFDTYLAQSGIMEDESEQYPVLVDDYVIYEEEKRMGNAFRYEPGDEMWLDFTVGGENAAKEFSVLGTAKGAPPYPYFSRNLEAVNGFRQYEASTVHLYMRNNDLIRLLEAVQYKAEVRKYVYADIKRMERSESYSWIDRVIYRKKLKEKAQEDREFQKEIIRAASDMGMSQVPLNQRTTGEAFHQYMERDMGYALGSAAIWESEQMFTSSQSLKRMFIYGMAVLTIALSLTSVFQNISMSMRVRKREFAVLHSIGMTKMGIFRMVMTENAMFVFVGALFGIPFSIFLMYQIWNEQFTRYGTIPVQIILIQVIILILLALVPAFYIWRQLKNLNMIEDIKAEG